MVWTKVVLTIILFFISCGKISSLNCTKREIRIFVHRSKHLKFTLFFKTFFFCLLLKPVLSPFLSNLRPMQSFQGLLKQYLGYILKLLVNSVKILFIEEKQFDVTQSFSREHSMAYILQEIVFSKMNTWLQTNKNKI